MTNFELKEISIDLREFLHERSIFTGFAKTVLEKLGRLGKTYIVVPENFVFENQSFRHGHMFPAGSLEKLNEYINYNSDVSLLVSDDYCAKKSDGFLKKEENTYNFFNDQVVWVGETPMDLESLSGTLNSDSVHSLTIGIRNGKIKQQKQDITELELEEYIKKTAFLIFSIFDDETYLIVEIL